MIAMSRRPLARFISSATSSKATCRGRYLPHSLGPRFSSASRRTQTYTLEDRSISCRGAWHIKSYDINEAGQVHVYIGDLAKLPIAEQNYWKAFNEWPKSSISARAHRTDIEGQWCTTYDPLTSLRNKVRALDKASPEWWNRRGDALMDSVLAPATDSRKNGEMKSWRSTNCWWRAF